MCRRNHDRHIVTHNKDMSEKPQAPGPQNPTPSTTFVQADASAFKELVQRLTGPQDEPRSITDSPMQGSSASSKATGCKRPTFKLQERRHGASRSKLTITKPKPSGTGFSASPGQSPSPQGQHALSPSTRMSKLDLNEEEEEKAIKERRFYLHPSPWSQSKDSSEPELLQLFPLTSPMNCPRLPPMPPL